MATVRLEELANTCIEEESFCLEDKKADFERIKEEEENSKVKICFFQNREFKILNSSELQSGFIEEVA